MINPGDLMMKFAFTIPANLGSTCFLGMGKNTSARAHSEIFLVSEAVAPT